MNLAKIEREGKVFPTPATFKNKLTKIQTQWNAVPVLRMQSAVCSNKVTLERKPLLTGGRDDIGSRSASR